MSSILTYLLAAGIGVLIAHLFSRAPELRSMRLAQLVLVPGAMVLCVYFSATGGMVGFTCFLAILGFLALLLAPNIAYHFGAGLSNFLDPHDWTPTEQELALRPIRRLIDKDQYNEALAELDELLTKHKPTYEAVLIKAKLLHHFGSVDETVATLLSLIALSKTTEQQLEVMELLDLLEEHRQIPVKPPASGAREIEIRHELVLFPTAGETSAPHKEIPPGKYEVEEIFHRNRLWLKLAGEDWGNAERCWEAILAIDRPTVAPPEKGISRPIARMLQAITIAIKGKPRMQLQAEAQKLFNEANQFIRRDDWHTAVPLLQKASACDPDRYEIAYRWVLAVRHTANDAVTAQAVSQVLRQSQWTESERHMLHQLKSPLPNANR
jgi:thioredoxin-like negative regulator of GroEL